MTNLTYFSHLSAQHAPGGIEGQGLQRLAIASVEQPAYSFNRGRCIGAVEGDDKASDAACGMLAGALGEEIG
jgi:hypothetical protein